MTKSIARKYGQLMDLLTSFLQSRGARPPASEAEWDSATAVLKDYMFLDGASANAGEKLLAAVLWFNPNLARSAGGRMAVCRQSLRGWRRLAPPGGRLPLPLAVVHMIAHWLLRRGLRDECLAVLLMLECYLRPSEPLLLRPRDVVPGRRAAGELQFTSLVLHPFELATPSKSQEFDQTLLLDLPRQRALAQALVQLARERAHDDQLLRVTPAGLREHLADAALALRLEALGHVHPYRLRHTGASVDFACRCRQLGEVQRRGR